MLEWLVHVTLNIIARDQTVLSRLAAVCGYLALKAGETVALT
jgi:hypothetical protein